MRFRFQVFSHETSRRQRSLYVNLFVIDTDGDENELAKFTLATFEGYEYMDETSKFDQQAFREHPRQCPRQHRRLHPRREGDPMTFAPMNATCALANGLDGYGFVRRTDWMDDVFAQ